MYAIIYTYSMKTYKINTKQQFLSEIKDLWPITKGTLAEVYKPCIRPACKACASGKKHKAFIFSYKEKNRRRCMYVPVELVAELRQAIHNGRQLEEMMGHIGSEIIQQYRKQHGGTISRGARKPKG